MPAILIRSATVEELRTALADPNEFARAAGVPAPSGWPVKREMFEYAAARLPEHPEEADWLVYLFLKPAFLSVPVVIMGLPSIGLLRSATRSRPGSRRKGAAPPPVGELLIRAAATKAVDTVIGKLHSIPTMNLQELLASFSRSSVSRTSVPCRILRLGALSANGNGTSSDLTRHLTCLVRHDNATSLPIAPR